MTKSAKVRVELTTQQAELLVSVLRYAKLKMAMEQPITDPDGKLLELFDKVGEML